MIGLALALGAGCKPAASPATAAPTAISISVEQETAAPAADPLADIDARIERVRAAFDVPGLAVAIVEDGKVVHQRGYGVRERGKPEPVDEHTTFAIASNTKAFLGTLIALHVHDGKLAWDDKVKDRLKGFRMHDARATSDMRIDDLLSHRGGLDTWAGDLAWIGAKTDTPTLMKKLRHVEPAWDLRTKYGYCNLTFMVAGEVIRGIDGKPWDVQVRERILDPLGMKRTTVSVGELAAQDNVATPHQDDDGNEVKTPYLNVDMVGAAASLNSSAADMARWLLVQTGDGEVDGKRVLPEKVVRDLRVPRTPIPVREGDVLGRNLQAYGLGWFLYDYRGHLVVNHGGGLPGMISKTAYLPDIGVGVAVLTNSESPAAGMIVNDIIDAYVGAPKRDYVKLFEERKAEREKRRAEREAKEPEAHPKPASLKLPKYAGRFKQPLLGKAIVESTDDGLTLALPDHGGLDCTLKHADADVFDCDWSDPMFGTSKVTFEVAGGRAKKLRFRVRPSFIDPVEYVFVR